MGTQREAKTSHFTPRPIPEARAYGWDDLLEPTRHALAELVQWLTAASDTSSQMPQDEHLSTSLLISGARGSGKTTVLLSAELALKDCWNFAYGMPEKEIPFEIREADSQKKQLVQTLSRIHPHIIWLDPLDLEPLPVKANLLATLLVRVRSALEDPDINRSSHTAGGWSSSSLLQESAEATWGTLDQLVRDASFMWEDISSTDARSRAELQIRAAEIFINFKPRFSKAMEEVARTLALPRFGTDRDKEVILVLPIDNVDRSIEHLYNIVKLTRMVTSRRLWFVLAAGHQEFQLFMERSFQNELITAGQAGLGPKGHDETLAIARRQAATTLRRALPPSYRIDLKPVDPDTAWGYSWQQPALGKEPPLWKLLTQLRLPERYDGATSDGDAAKQDGGDAPKKPLTSFADLFNLRERLDKDVAKRLLAIKELAEEKEEAAPDEATAALRDQEAAARPMLTHSARLALTLPARTLQDLWHAAYRESEDPSPNDGEKAVRVATGMLRNAIDESDLPAWASQQLLNRIIRQDVRGRIVLDLTGKPVSRSKRTSLSDAVELLREEPPPGKSRAAGDGGRPHGGRERVRDPRAPEVLISELHLRHFQDVLLVLNDLETPGNSVLMPPNVCGWFMLLHDLLMLFEQPRVLNLEVTPFEMSPELVVTRHELWMKDSSVQPSVQLDFWWSPPTWDTFTDFAVFTAQWKVFLHELRGLVQLHNQKRDAAQCKRLFRFVQAAWVENVCSVAGDTLGRWHWEGDTGVSAVIASLKKDTDTVKLEQYEQQVRTTVSRLLQLIDAKSQGYDRLWIARTWLEQSLPLLALPEFAPDPEFSQLLDWDAPDTKKLRAAKERWLVLVDSWARHVPRLTRARQNLVRAVAARSGAADSLRQGSGGARLLHEWLDLVDSTWFHEADRDSGDRKIEELRRMEVPRRPEEPPRRERGEPPVRGDREAHEGMHS